MRARMKVPTIVLGTSRASSLILQRSRDFVRLRARLKYHLRHFACGAFAPFAFTTYIFFCIALCHLADNSLLYLMQYPKLDSAFTMNTVVQSGSVRKVLHEVVGRLPLVHECNKKAFTRVDVQKRALVRTSFTLEVRFFVRGKRKCECVGPSLGVNPFSSAFGNRPNDVINAAYEHVIYAAPAVKLSNVSDYESPSIIGSLQCALHN